MFFMNREENRAQNNDGGICVTQEARSDSPGGCLSALRALRRIAAPSWVRPASLAENCRFLAGRVDEAGLLFFDARSSLAYGDDDMPPELAALPLAYHVHLPLDLPWHDPGAAAEICHRLLKRCAFLAGEGEAETGENRAGEEGTGRDEAGRGETAQGKAGVRGGIRGVLHPPAKAGAKTSARGGANSAYSTKNRGADADRRLLEEFIGHFARLGGDASLLMLENTPENDLSALADTMRAANMGVCLDLGHLLARGQEEALLHTGVMERVRMLHLSAPGADPERIRHLPLTALDRRGLATGRRLCREAPQDAVLMVELFSWARFEESLPVLLSWLLPEV